MPAAMRPNAALCQLVRERAAGRCEYCRFPEEHAVPAFEVEHIVPYKHAGLTEDANLALACFYCNRYKGPNVGGIDSEYGVVVRLFHPRLDDWSEHFQWSEDHILPRTAVGRVTVAVLRLNQPNALTVRRELMAGGLW